MQVNGGDSLNIQDKENLDYFYCKIKSITFDIFTIFNTFVKVEKSDDISK